MREFSQSEIEYLNSQLLGRLATADKNSRPHVTPVGFRYNAETGTIDISGYNFETTKKFRDLKANPYAAFVVDDLASVDPWRPRGVIVRGPVELHEGGGERSGRGFGDVWIRIQPERIISWGIHATITAAR